MNIKNASWIRRDEQPEVGQSSLAYFVSRTYSIAPNTRANKAMRITTPLKASCQ